MSLTIGLICPPTLKHRSELFFPVNLTILSAAAKEAGFDARIIDFNPTAEQTGPSYYEDILGNVILGLDEAQKECDILGFTTLCSTYPLILQLADICKKRYKKPIIFGGVQATITARETMEAFPSVDVIVTYEGEQTMVELMRAFDGEGSFDEVKGLLFRDSRGDIIDTGPRGFMKDLDESPFPDFDALDMEAYLEIYPNLRLPLDIGRACPFACTFCSTSVMWGRKCRMKSPGRVVAEMDALYHGHGVSNFFFTQDNFTTKRDYVKEFCDTVKDRGYTWDCYSRVDTLDYSLLDEMKTAGCTHIFFGIESTSPRTQKMIRKNISLERAEESIQECIKRDIPFTTSYIIGFPEEGEEDIERTLRSVLHDSARQTFRVMLNVLAPFPGTAITNENRNRLISPLAYQPDASPFDLINRAADQARKWILEYPDIFTVYYFIKPDHFTIDELFEVRRFCGMLIDHFPCTTHTLAETLDLSLFRMLGDYKGAGFILDPEHVGVDEIPTFLKGIMLDNQKGLGDRFHLVLELLKYEQTIYRLRRMETPQVLFENARRVKECGLDDFLHEELIVSPAVTIQSFECDIRETFKNLRHDRLALARPFRAESLLFYHDIVQDDIVTLLLDPEARMLLETIRGGGQYVRDYLGQNSLIEEMWRRGIVLIGSQS